MQGSVITVQANVKDPLLSTATTQLIQPTGEQLELWLGRTKGANKCLLTYQADFTSFELTHGLVPALLLNYNLSYSYTWSAVL